MLENEFITGQIFDNAIVHRGIWENPGVFTYLYIYFANLKIRPFFLSAFFRLFKIKHFAPTSILRIISIENFGKQKLESLKKLISINDAALDLGIEHGRTFVCV